jgi:predicted nucleic acid-binding Zn ribbon protein
MYCPKCGTAVAEDQKFCRSCGLNLIMVAQIVAGHPPTAEPDQTLIEILEKLRNRRKKMKALGAVIMMAGLITWGLIFLPRMLFPGGIEDLDLKILYLLSCIFLGLFLFAGGLFLLAGAVLIAPNMLESSVTKSPTQGEGFTNMPASYSEPISSTTDHTTYILEPVLSKQPKVPE